MPLDKFGYYSLVEPLQKDTTKESESTSTLREIDMGYNLNYYSHLKSSEQTSLAVDIITDLERQKLLLVMKENGDLNFMQRTRLYLIPILKCSNVLDEKKNK
jgi:hypothetical protein